MPQRSYTNADLPRFARQPLGVTIEQRRVPPDEGVPDEIINSFNPPLYSDVDQLLANAKGALAGANRFSRETFPQENEADQATLARSMRQPSVTDTAAERLAKIGRDYKARHEYAMSQPAEQALGALAEGVAAPLALTGYGPAMVGQSALNLASRGTEGVTEHPIATAFDVGMLATPALRGLKSYVNAGRAAETTAQNALMANQAERELVDQYASRELAKGSQARPSTILRKAHEATGRIHGEQNMRTMQLHPDYPDLPEDVVKGIEQRKIAARQPAVAELGQPSYQGLLDALKTAEPEDLSAFEQGPVIRSGMGSRTPEQAALYNRNVSGLRDAAENTGAKVNMSRPRTTTNASGESMASQEALNRQSSMKAKGEQFVVIGRDGKMRPLIGPDAVDYTPRPGERYGISGKNGFRLLQEGSVTQRLGRR